MLKTGVNNDSAALCFHVIPCNDSTYAHGFSTSIDELPHEQSSSEWRKWRQAEHLLQKLSRCHDLVRRVSATNSSLLRTDNHQVS
ncbi:hypothetical protein ABBQ38_002984 [Trebouxia sp. C0009 RCD-2024]